MTEVIAVSRVRHSIDVSRRVRHSVDVIAVTVIIEMRGRVRHVVDVGGTVTVVLRRLVGSVVLLVGAAEVGTIRWLIVSVASGRSITLVRRHAVILRSRVGHRIDVCRGVGHGIDVIPVPIVVRVRGRVRDMVNVCCRVRN